MLKFAVNQMDIFEQIGGHLKKSQQILDITMELQKDHQLVIMH